MLPPRLTGCSGWIPHCYFSKRTSCHCDQTAQSLFWHASRYRFWRWGSFLGTSVYGDVKLALRWTVTLRFQQFPVHGRFEHLSLGGSGLFLNMLINFHSPEDDSLGLLDTKEWLLLKYSCLHWWSWSLQLIRNVSKRSSWFVWIYNSS